MKIFFASKTMLIFLPAALVLSACGGAQTDSPNMKDPSEKLLAGKGQWNLVEDEKSVDPLARNMAARATVHPQGEAYSVAATPAPVNVPDGKTDPLANMSFRVLRLERQMGDLRRDVDTLLPDNRAMTISSVSDMASAPVSSAPAPAAASSWMINGLRAGEHPGKTRIVLDASASGAYTVEIDNTEKVLIINLPGARWSGPPQADLKTSIVSGYSVQNAAGGDLVIVVSLNRAARIASKMIIPPSGNSGTRIVIDLAPE